MVGLAFAYGRPTLQGSRGFGFRVFLLLAFAYRGILYKAAWTLNRYYHYGSEWTWEQWLIKG